MTSKRRWLGCLARPAAASTSVQDGFSILEVMIAAGIIAVATAAGLSFFSASHQQQKALATAQSADEIEQALQGALIHQMQTSGCFTPATLFNNLPLGNFGTMNFTNNVNFTFRGTIDAGTQAPFNAARGRCQQPHQPTAANNNSYYFCLSLSGQAGAPVTSLLHSPNAFAEVYLDTRDFRSDQPISCSAYDALMSSAGAKLYYTLYWTTEGAQGSILKYKTASAYIGH